MTVQLKNSKSRIELEAEEEEEQPSIIYGNSIVKCLLPEFDTPTSNRPSETQCMKVYLRIRPFLESEKKNNEDKGCLSIDFEGNKITVKPPEESKSFKNRSVSENAGVNMFSFTRIFGENCGQKDFFEQTTLSHIEDFLSGADALIFTYGVTNAGKSFTINGPKNNVGILPRFIDVLFSSTGDKLVKDSKFQTRNAKDLYMLTQREIRTRNKMKSEIIDSVNLSEIETQADGSALSFRASTSQTSMDSLVVNDLANTSIGVVADAEQSFVELANHPNKRYAFFMSFVELYKEQIFDLLVPLADSKKMKRPALQLGEDLKGIPFLKGVREIQVNTREEMMALLHFGRQHLHIAATKLNHCSSRSHCIFSVKAVQVINPDNPQQATISTISFCDLAGSERSKNTRSDGIHLREASKINLSLLTLGKCMEALRQKKLQRLAPFRESSLTHLFKRFFTGKGIPVMIVNASPCASSFDETVQAFKMSAIARQIKNMKEKKERYSRARSSYMMPSYKAKRETMEWEVPPAVPEEDEDEENDDVTEESESEDDDAYWKAREEKIFEGYNKLKDKFKLLAEKYKEKCIKLGRLEISLDKQIASAREEERKEVLRRMNDNIAKVKERHEEEFDNWMEYKDEVMQDRLDFVQKHYQERMQKLQDHYEEENAKLKEKIEELGGKEEERSDVGGDNEDNTVRLQNKDEMDESEEKSDAERNSTENKTIKHNAMEDEQKAKFDRLLKDNKELTETLENVVKGKDELMKKFDQILIEKDDSSKKVEQVLLEKDELVAINDNLQAQVKANEAVNEALKIDVAALKNDLVKEKTKTQNMEQEFDDRRKELEKENQMSKTLENQLIKETDRLYLKVQELETKMADMSKKTDKRTSEASYLTQDVNILTEERNDLLKRTTDLQNELSKVKQANKNLEENITQMNTPTRTVKENTEIDEMKRAIADMDKLQTEQQSLIESLEQEGGDLKKERDNLKQQINQLEKKCSNVEEEKLKSIEEAQGLKDSLGKKNEEIEKMKDEIESLEDKLNLANEQASSHEKELKLAKKEHESKIKEVEKAASIKVTEQQSLIESLEQERDNLKKVHDDLKQQINQLEEKCSNLEGEKLKIPKLIEEVKESENNLVKKNEEIEKMKDEIDSLEDKLNLANEQIPSLEKEIESLKKQLESKIKQIENNGNKEKTEQQSLIESLEQEGGDLKKERDNLKQQINQLEEKCSSVEEEKLKELDKFRKARDRIVDSLEKSINAQKSSNELLKSKLDEQIHLNVQLKSKLAESQAEKVALERSASRNNTPVKRNPTVVIPETPITIAKIKEEPFSPPTPMVTLHDMSTSAGTPLSNLEPVEEDKENIYEEVYSPKRNEVNKPPTSKRKSQKQEEEQKEEEDGVVEKKAKRSSSRSSTREKPVRKTSSRSTRKRVTKVKMEAINESSDAENKIENAPPPLPESSPVVRKTSSRRKRSQKAELTEVNIENEFPEPTMEIDMTPQLKKAKSSRRKKDKTEMTSVLTEARQATTRLTRKLRRHTNVEEKVDSDYDSASITSTKSVLKRGKDAAVSNMEKMGDIIKNSPVANALRKIGASPSNNANTIQQATKSPASKTRRRRLQPVDISLPLEALSPADDGTPGVIEPVTETPARMLRRLRSRK